MDPILEIARKHKLRVLEDCAQCCGGKYKEVRGHDRRYRHQQLPAQQDDHLRRRRGHDDERSGALRAGVSLPRRGRGGTLLQRIDRRGVLAGFASCSFRMNEFTGAVLRGQLKKLEIICSAAAGQRKESPREDADLPGLKLRKSGDIEGDLGMRIFLDMGTRERRPVLRAIPRRGISANGPGGSAILPPTARGKQGDDPPDWPSFRSPRARRSVRRVLPANHRCPRPPRRCNDRPQVHRGGCCRRRQGDPQGLPRHAQGVGDRTPGDAGAKGPGLRTFGAMRSKAEFPTNPFMPLGSQP